MLRVLLFGVSRRPDWTRCNKMRARSRAGQGLRCISSSVSVFQLWLTHFVLASIRLNGSRTLRMQKSIATGNMSLSYTVQCRLRCEGDDGCCPVRPQFSIKDARKGWLEACPVGSIAQSMQLRHPARKATDPSSTARRATQSRRAAVVAFCGWQNEKLLRCSAAERVTLRREETRMRGNSCVHFAHSKTAI